MLTRILGMAAAALLLVAGPAQAQQRDKVTLLLNWYVYGEYAPFYYGLAKGLYAAENIDLDIQEGRGSGTTVQAVAAGSANIGYADFGTMAKASTKGAPVKAIGVLMQKSPLAVIGFSDKNVRKPTDIKGKSMILTAGDGTWQMLPAFLKMNNLAQSDFKLMTGDAAAKRNAVMTGQADLMMGFVNVQPVELTEATGKPVTSLLMADFGIELMGQTLFARTDYLKNNADLVRRFMKATTAALAVVAKDHEAGVEAIMKLNPKAPKKETLMVQWKETVQLIHTKRTAGLPPFKLDEADLNATLDMLTQYSELDRGNRKASDFYDGSFTQ